MFWGIRTAAADSTRAGIVAFLCIFASPAEDPGRLHIPDGGVPPVHTAAETRGGALLDLKHWNDVGTDYHRSGDYDNAERSYLKAIRVLRSIEPKDANLYTPVLNLFSLYIDFWQGSKADSLVGQLDGLAPGWRTSNHPNAAGLLFSAGSTYVWKGRYSEAEEMLIRAAGMLKTFDTTRLYLASALNSLTVLYAHTDRLEDALVHGEEACNVYRSLKDPPYPQLAACLANMAAIYVQAGNLVKAAPYMNEAVRMMGDHVGSMDPSRVIIYTAFVHYLRETGQKRESKRVERRLRELTTAMRTTNSLKYSIEYNGDGKPVNR